MTVAVLDPVTDGILGLADSWGGAIGLARELAARTDAAVIVAILGEAIGWEVPPDGPSRPVFYSSFFCVWSY